MIKRTRLILPVVLFLNIISVETVMTQTTATEDPAVEKVKKQVAKLGTGTKAKVRIHLIYGRKVQGYINTIGNDSFTVIRTDQGYIGVARRISYDDVTKLDGKGASRETSLDPPKSSTIVITIVEGILEFLRGLRPVEIKP